MAANRSNGDDEFISDELLSGYLDNELSIEERGRVERALESNDRYRQILSELETLRSGLGALPQQKVDAEFQRRVLDRIATGESAVANNTSSVSTPASSQFRRNILGFSAIAAGLTIMVVSNWKQDTQVAVSHEESAASAPSAKQSIAEELPDQETDSVIANNNANRQITFSSTAQQDAILPEQDSVDSMASSDQIEKTADTPETDPPFPAEIAADDPIGMSADTSVADDNLASQSNQPESVSFPPKQLASLVRSVQQAKSVDLIVSIRVGDRNADATQFLSLMAKSLPEHSLTDAIGQQQLADSRQLYSFAITPSLPIATLTSDGLIALSEKLESTGNEVVTIDAASILANASDPAVRHSFRLYAEADQRPYRAPNAQDEPRSKQADLFIDLDANPSGSVDRQQGNAIEIAESESWAADTQKEYRVLFVVLPGKESP